MSTVLLLIGIGWFGSSSVELLMKENLSRHLKSTLDKSEEALKVWAGEKKINIENWAGEPFVRTQILSLVGKALSGEMDSEKLSSAPELALLRERLGPFARKHRHTGFVVFDRTGLQVAALLDGPIGKREIMKRSDFVSLALKGETVLSLPFPGEIPLPTLEGKLKKQWPTMFVAAPVYDDAGEVAAVLSFRIKPEIGFSRILKVGRSENTGEAYVFNRDGLMISDSRFNDQLREMRIISNQPDSHAILKVRLVERAVEGQAIQSKSGQGARLTLMARSAVQGQSGFNVDGYPDYRGIPVVGAWTWLPELNFGLATEIDVAEAHKPIIGMKKVFLILFILLVFATAFAVVMRTRNRRIENDRVKFIDQLKEARDHLETKVRKRTRELEWTNQRLRMEIEVRSKVESRLDKEKKMAQTYLDSVVDGIITIDSKGIIDTFSPAAEMIFGYTKSEVLGRNVSLLMPEPFTSEHDSYLQRYFESGKPQVIGVGREVVGLRKDGKSIPIDLAINEVDFGDDKKFIGIIRDLTERKKVESRLTGFGRILEQISEEIYIFDAESLKFVQTNRGAAQNLGYSCEELLEMTPVDLKPEFTLGKFREAIQPLQSGAESLIKFETVHMRKNGSVYPVEVRLQFMQIGVQPVFVALVQDITERIKAQTELKNYAAKLEQRVEARTHDLNNALDHVKESKERINAILMSVGNGLVVVKEDGRVSMINWAAQKLMNVSLEDAIDRPINALIGNEVFNKEMNQLLRSDICGQFDIEMPGNSPAKPRIIRIRVSHIRDVLGGEKGDFILAMTDVTREQEINRMKTEFISTAAHELRTPLTSIRGYSEILARKKIADPEKVKRFLSRINRESEHLASIIDDLLDISRIESGEGTKYKFERGKVSDYLHAMVQIFKEQYSSHRFEVAVSDKTPEWVIDLQKMEQVFKNLLSNAVKYSPDGGTIRVKAERKGRDILVSVSDEGIGMTQEQVSKVFEKFYRADSSNTAIQGTGLGMTIVRYLVEGHGGRVWIDSKPRKGTTVRFLVPGATNLAEATKEDLSIPEHEMN